MNLTLNLKIFRAFTRRGTRSNRNTQSNTTNLNRTTRTNTGTLNRNGNSLKIRPRDKHRHTDSNLHTIGTTNIMLNDLDLTNNDIRLNNVSLLRHYLLIRNMPTCNALTNTFTCQSHDTCLVIFHRQALSWSLKRVGLVGLSRGLSTK